MENSNTGSFAPSLSKYDPIFLPLLIDALRSQLTIGWGQALKGFLSQEWREIVTQRNIHVPTQMDPSKGKTGLCSMIDATYKFICDTWLSRNSALHGILGGSDALQICNAEVAEIWHYHSLPHLLPAHAQHYSSHLLNKLIKGPASNQRQWLRKVKKSVSYYQQDGSRQPPLTSFFMVSVHVLAFYIPYIRI